VGYRLFDTAELYGNEQQLGEMLRRPGSPPHQALFLVSKVWNTNHAYAHVIAACEKTLRELGLAYLDLYLIHWPYAWQYRGPLEQLMSLSHAEAGALTFPKDEAGDIVTADVPLEETWRAMETLLACDWVRAIGVSNFDREHLDTLLASAHIPPAVNQIACHPYHLNNSLVSWCKAHDIAVMAHSPLSAPDLLQEPLLLALAQRYGKTPAQIVLRWHVQNGVVPLPSSTNPAHMAANLDIFHFDLSPRDMGAINTLQRPDSNQRH
jgi:alcohol dehydrogenase (NADP+)